MTDPKALPDIATSDIDVSGAASALRLADFKRHQSALSMYLATIREERRIEADKVETASTEPAAT